MSTHPDASLYLAKLDARVPFSDAARKAFLALPARRDQVHSGSDIVTEGDRPARSYFVESGFVSRSKSLREGRRQIVAFHMQGDMVDLQSALVIVADHSITVHADTTLISFAHGDLLKLAADYPEIARAFWFDTLVDAAVFREWTLNVGSRTALMATAHLLLELHYRFNEVGLAENGSFEMPVTQAELSEALGLSVVHTNRSLQALRGDGLIRTFRRQVTISDMDRMAELAEFTPLYMHPEGPRQVIGS
jgi:CRP-like cAMP-binding protein